MRYSDEFDDLFTDTPAPDAAPEKDESAVDLAIRSSLVTIGWGEQSTQGILIGTSKGPNRLWPYLWNGLDADGRDLLDELHSPTDEDDDVPLPYTYAIEWLQSPTDVEATTTTTADVAIVGDDASVGDGLHGHEHGIGNAAKDVERPEREP